MPSSGKYSQQRGVFMISVAAELAQMHPQTLRVYEMKGLIEPQRSEKGTRLYSHEDIQRLRYIQQLTVELGLNLAGVQRVLSLEARERIAARRIQQLQQQQQRLLEQNELLEVAVEQQQQELQRLKSSRGGELVPYRERSREIVTIKYRNA